MGQPLFTVFELADWDTQRANAREPKPGDHHGSTYQRLMTVEKAWRVESLRRIRRRPDDLLNGLLVAFAEKGGGSPLLWDDIFENRLGNRLKVADTPELRKHIHTVISGLKVVPRTWAKSATTRFFRGIGKQGEPPWTTKPGAGMLSKAYGWRTFEANWFVDLFYSPPLDGVFFTDDSIELGSDESREIDEEGGNRFAATLKTRDDEFFDTLIGILEARGLADDVHKPHIPAPKPHRVKVFGAGDEVSTRNMRDLPPNSHVRLVRVKYPYGYRGPSAPPEFEAVESTWELVVVLREPKELQIRPVMQGKAFQVQPLPSSTLYREGYDYQEVTTTYLGPWTGEVVDVKVARDGWVPKTRTVRRRREGKFPDEKVVPATGSKSAPLA